VKLYIISLAVGLLVGLLYGVLQVRSPAPPAIALIGLLGMLLGEQIVPTVKRMVAGAPAAVAWVQGDCAAKIHGIEHLQASGTLTAAAKTKSDEA
jgi:XapX domain-containing protein